MSTSELKRDVLVFSRNYPIDFMDILDDPSLQIKDDVALFFQNGLLSLRNKQRDVYFNLSQNKKKFLTVPFGEDPTNYIDDIEISYEFTGDPSSAHIYENTMCSPGPQTTSAGFSALASLASEGGVFVANGASFSQNPENFRNRMYKYYFRRDGIMF